MKAKSILMSAVFASALASSASTWADLPTVRVESRQSGSTHAAEATIEAVNQVTVSAQMAGRVVELRVDAGDAVVEGERLLRIDASAVRLVFFTALTSRASCRRRVPCAESAAAPRHRCRGGGCRRRRARRRGRAC